MLGREAGKLLDATDYMVTQAGRRAISLGAWVVPFCYRWECRRLTQNSSDAEIDRAREECIVRGLGQLTLETAKGRHGIRKEQLDGIVQAVRPSLKTVSYDDVFDPHTAQLLEHVEPLHDDGET